jgi:hypothetical protein
LSLVTGIYAIAALASSLAAVLAWVSKLWWAKEYTAAKNETIHAKEAQIELLKTELQNLRELSPMKLREYFISVKEQLEEYNNKLREELESANDAIKKKDSEITHLLESNQGLFPGGPQVPDNVLAAKAESYLRNLTESRKQLQVKASSLEQKLRHNEELRKNFVPLYESKDATNS